MNFSDKKLIYIATARLPTEKAHGIQIMKMCESFARSGVDVELIIPKRRNRLKDDPFNYYGVERIFTVTSLPTLDAVGLIPRVGLWLASIVFSFFLILNLLRKEADIIYSRNNIPLYFLSFLDRRMWWEPHVGSWNFVTRRVLKKVEGLVAITQGGKDFFIERGMASGEVLVAHDAVDLEHFDVDASKNVARERLALPQSQKIVMYIGLFDEWKGYRVLLDAAKELEEERILTVMMGGTNEQVAQLKREYPHVYFTGYRPYSELPFNQKAADVLVIPNSSKSEVSTRFTSPLKLFSYMASSRPIVGTDIPSLKEVLTHEKNVILVEPDDPQALAVGIKRVINDRALAERIASQALEDVRKHTWQKRAEKILTFMTQ